MEAIKYLCFFAEGIGSGVYDLNCFEAKGTVQIEKDNDGKRKTSSSDFFLPMR
jgi:hypothetical protein